MRAKGCRIREGKGGQERRRKYKRRECRRRMCVLEEGVCKRGARSARRKSSEGDLKVAE